VLIYRDHGPREARSKCRLAFLIEDWGLERLRRELESRFGRQLETAGEDARSALHADHLGVTLQNQTGLAAVGVSIPTGRLNPDEMEELARLAEHYGNSQIRLTTSQNAIIPNVPEAKLERLLREPLLEKFPSNPSPFFRRMVACTGTDFCNLAQVETKKLSVELSRALEQRLGRKGRAVSIHWSGCPAGCGNHQAADIGLRGMKINVGGKLVDAVAIYSGGRTGRGAVAGTEILEAVPCDEHLVDVVAALVEKMRSTQPVEHAGAALDLPVSAGLVSIEGLPPSSLQHSAVASAAGSESLGGA
jgi:ferredoxin-nitrite reductase